MVAGRSVKRSTETALNTFTLKKVRKGKPKKQAAFTIIQSTA